MNNINEGQTDISTQNPIQEDDYTTELDRTLEEMEATANSGETMNYTLGMELREAARTVHEAVHDLRCYSVIQPTIAALTDHLTAMAGNSEKLARITELEAEVVRLKARDTLGPYRLIHSDHLAGLDARIAELEDALAESERNASDIADAYNKRANREAVACTREREACAAIAAGYESQHEANEVIARQVAKNIAAAIRARPAP